MLPVRNDELDGLEPSSRFCRRLEGWIKACRKLAELMSAAEYLLIRVGLLVAVAVFLLLYLTRHSAVAVLPW